MVARFLPWLIALLLALGGAVSPVVAQCRLCTAPTTATDEAGAIPVKLEVETSLDFARTATGPHLA